MRCRREIEKQNTEGMNQTVSEYEGFVFQRIFLIWTGTGSRAGSQCFSVCVTRHGKAFVSKKLSVRKWSKWSPNNSKPQNSNPSKWANWTHPARTEDKHDLPATPYLSSWSIWLGKKHWEACKSNICILFNSGSKTTLLALWGWNL